MSRVLVLGFLVLFLSSCHTMSHYLDPAGYEARKAQQKSATINSKNIDPDKKEWCKQTYLDAYGISIYDTKRNKKYLQCVSENSSLFFSKRTQAGKNCEASIRAWDKYRSCKRRQTSNSYGCGYLPTYARNRPTSCPK